MIIIRDDNETIYDYLDRVKWDLRMHITDKWRPAIVQVSCDVTMDVLKFVIDDKHNQYIDATEYISKNYDHFIIENNIDYL